MSYSVKYEKININKELPLNLDIVKQYLNVSQYNTENDYLLTELVFMASEYAEWYMEKTLTKSKWKLVCDGYIPKRINLSFGPVEIIDSINITKDNIQTVLSKDEYIFDQDLWCIFLKNCLGDAKIVIHYSAGYTQDTLPYPIKCGILQHVYYLYISHGKITELKTVMNDLYIPFKMSIRL